MITTRKKSRNFPGKTGFPVRHYVASHDLQGPLRQVSGFAQLLVARRYQGQLDGNADKFIGQIVEGTHHMQELIRDLLSFTRVNTLEDALQPVSCASVVEQVLKNLAMDISDPSAIITHDSLPMVMENAIQLVQIFQNLLAHAIKFRGSDLPRIHVAAERRQGEWLFSVQDNGIGIEEHHQERIFTIFQRLHTRVKYPGTGIGLAICKRIAERHGGDIWVKSVTGQGSTFFFTIRADDWWFTRAELTCQLFRFLWCHRKFQLVNSAWLDH